MSAKPKSKPPLGKEFFYSVRGKRMDAELHEPILEAGDHEAATDVSRKVMERLGYSKEQIDGFLGRSKKPVTEKGTS
jgi:hypothetical protein